MGLVVVKFRIRSVFRRAGLTRSGFGLHLRLYSASSSRQLQGNVNPSATVFPLRICRPTVTESPQSAR